MVLKPDIIIIGSDGGRASALPKGHKPFQGKIASRLLRLKGGRRGWRWMAVDERMREEELMAHCSPKYRSERIALHFALLNKWITHYKASACVRAKPVTEYVTKYFFKFQYLAWEKVLSSLSLQCWEPKPGTWWGQVWDGWLFTRNQKTSLDGSRWEKNIIIMEH